MNSYDIYKQANNLMMKYGTTDPIKLARSMGIMLYNEDSLENLLGMYTYRWKHRIIIMNPNINDTLYKMVVAHEIGHDQRHRLLAGDGMKEFELFNMTDITEYEANAFASHLLMNETDMTELFKEGYDIATTAKMLNVNINLLLIKIQEMNRLGMNFKIPFDPDPNFFRKTRY